MRKTVLALAIVGFVGGLPAVQASEGHDHDGGHSHDSGMKHDDHAMQGHKDGHDHDMKHDDHGNMGGMFMKTKKVDDYDVTFHIMKPKSGSGMGMGGSHHVMVKVEKDGALQTGITMNTKVVLPGGKSETKPAMKMGDWYMAGYDLQDGKKNQVMILFKTPDGKKHKAGIYYQ